MSSGPGLARTERAALADDLEEIGPGSPTLCEGWDSADLLAHLLVRERRPDAAAGMLVPALRGHLASTTRGVQQRPWAEQVRTFRSGPPGWNPMGWGALDELSNGMEMLVHHEDLLRADPDRPVRVVDPRTHAAVMELLGSPLVTRRLRKADAGVVAHVTDLPDGIERALALSTGSPVVEIRGRAVDLLLWLAGRDRVELEFGGDPAAVDRVRGLALSM
jgi:uncharacterized protein (TIGR03085 family)